MENIAVAAAEYANRHPLPVACEATFGEVATGISDWAEFSPLPLSDSHISRNNLRLVEVVFLDKKRLAHAFCAGCNRME
jgi:hypothetical protein